MTIGDVLAVVAGVIGIALSGWALLITLALLFKDRAAYARADIERAPWPVFGTGLLLAVTLGVLAFALLNHPHGLVKLIGWAIMLTLLACSVLGAGGVAFLVDSRIRSLDPNVSEFTALARGGAMLVIASLMPLLGWFGFLPLTIMVSLGAGVRAILHKERPVAQATPATTLPASTYPAPAVYQAPAAYQAPAIQEPVNSLLTHLVEG